MQWFLIRLIFPGLIAMFLLAGNPLFAQTCAELKNDERDFKTNKSAFYGIYTHANPDSAYRRAYDQLLATLPRRVSSILQTSLKEGRDKPGQFLQSNSEKSGLFIEQTEISACEDRGKHTVLVAIRKDDLERSYKRFEAGLNRKLQYADSVFTEKEYDAAAKSYFEVQTLLNTYFLNEKPLYKNQPVEDYLLARTKVIQDNLVVSARATQVGGQLAVQLRTTLFGDEIDSWQTKIDYDGRELVVGRVELGEFGFVWEEALSQRKVTLTAYFNAYDPLRFDQQDALKAVNVEPDAFTIQKKVDVHFSDFIKPVLGISLFLEDKNQLTVKFEPNVPGIIVNRYVLHFGNTQKAAREGSSGTIYHSYAAAGTYHVQYFLGSELEPALEKWITLDGKGGLIVKDRKGTDLPVSKPLQLELIAFSERSMSDAEYSASLKKLYQKWQFFYGKFGDFVQKDRLTGIRYNPTSRKPELFLLSETGVVMSFTTGEKTALKPAEINWLQEN